MDRSACYVRAITSVPQARPNMYRRNPICPYIPRAPVYIMIPGGLPRRAGPVNTPGPVRAPPVPRPAALFLPPSNHHPDSDSVVVNFENGRVWVLGWGVPTPRARHLLPKCQCQCTVTSSPVWHRPIVQSVHATAAPPRPVRAAGDVKRCRSSFLIL